MWQMSRFGELLIPTCISVHFRWFGSASRLPNCCAGGRAMYASNDERRLFSGTCNHGERKGRQTGPRRDHLTQRNIAPVFAMVYDEFWQMFGALTPVLNSLLGEGYQMTPSDIWIWHISKHSAAKGWGPHRDMLVKESVRSASVSTFTARTARSIKLTMIPSGKVLLP